MPKIIEAVYENGVIKPLEKVEVGENKMITIIIVKEREKKYLRRSKFLSQLKPIDTGKKITLEEIERLRLERYESIS